MALVTSAAAHGQHLVDRAPAKFRSYDDLREESMSGVQNSTNTPLWSAEDDLEDILA